jgi:predicted amidohydrolase
MTDTTPADRFKAALVQMRAGRDVAANVRDATDLIRDAAALGADYVQTPETMTLMELERDKLFAATRPEEGNPALRHFQSLASDLGIWLHLGSLPILVRPDKIANRSFLISPDGRITARYDKIHMFDVDLPNGESYRESRNYEAGHEAVIAALPWGGLGMTICYDLRFPGLHRALAQGGASFIAIPAAFTKTTGEAHWNVLIRARAIETQCFVFAASQGGRHEHGRETYGHSLIVAPWGEVLAEAGIDPCVVVADIDLARVRDARSRVPSLSHDKPFTVLHR